MSETTRNQIKALPQEMQLKFFWAVMDFGLDGIEPNFDGIELAIWIPMRDLILNSKRQDKTWRSRRQENGKKGGRPRKEPINNENQDNLEVFNENQDNLEVFNENQDNLEVFNNDNDNVNENDNVNLNEGEKSPESESEKNKRYFLEQWQSHSDVFNAVSRIHNPDDFDYWWKKAAITRKEIDIAIKNVVDGLKNGGIERRFIPGSPDKFVLNGWIQRGQEPFVKKSGPSPPQKNWDTRNMPDISQPKEVI
jgi:hypothetical protein